MSEENEVTEYWARCYDPQKEEWHVFHSQTEAEGFLNANKGGFFIPGKRKVVSQTNAENLKTTVLFYRIQYVDVDGEDYRPIDAIYPI